MPSGASPLPGLTISSSPKNPNPVATHPANGTGSFSSGPDSSSTPNGARYMIASVSATGMTRNARTAHNDDIASAADLSQTSPALCTAKSSNPCRGAKKPITSNKLTA